MKSILITISTTGLIVGTIGLEPVTIELRETVAEYMYLPTINESTSVCLN